MPQQQIVLTPQQQIVHKFQNRYKLLLLILNQTTNGTSVDIDLQIKPFPVTKNVDTQFMITFLQPSTQSVQVHVDYDLAISKMNSEVFRASSKTGQPLLHTAEGIVKIPYKFDQGGQYSVQISVMGINFIPIKTEQALFDLKVS